MNMHLKIKTGLIFFLSGLLFFSTANAATSTKMSDVLPVASPVIIYVNHSVVAGEGPIIAVGMASIKTKVVVQLLDDQKQIVFEQIVPIDPNGHWSVSIDKTLNVGEYRLSAIATDEKMASSLPAVSDIIKISPRPTFVMGNLEINQVWFFFGLILLMLFAFIVGWFSYDNWLEQVDRRVTIAQRDVKNVIDNIDNDIDELLKNHTNTNHGECDLSQTKSILKNIKKNLEKSRGYIINNMRDIEK
jgi:hypothetical protein